MKRLLERVFRRALARVDLRERTRDALRALDGRDARVLAIGKAAGAMLEGALDALDARVALAIVPHDAPFASRDRRVAVVRASHPIPDRTSVAAAHDALAFAREPSGMLVVLVSGGASSLVCAPRGVTLARKRSIVRALLRAEATIVDVNVVRRHLSAIKGGGLLDAAAPERVVTLIASDVIGGAPHDIGSGPSVPDPTTCADARRVFRRFLADDPPPFVETRKPRRSDARKHPARIVASPEDLARAAAAAGAAETKRTPFDVPEGEAEIVGYHVEYSGMKFGMFLISDFIESIVIAGLIATIYLGGWQVPWVQTLDGVSGGVIMLVSFTIKVLLVLFLLMQIRWTLPRFRFDQVLDLGWKNILPLALLNFLATVWGVYLWGMR